MQLHEQAAVVGELDTKRASDVASGDGRRRSHGGPGETTQLSLDGAG